MIRTPDGRYLVVRGRLWRATRPDLDPAERERLVRELMAARRAVRRDPDARARVHAAKVALGERGPVWWTDGARDYNRHLAKNTPYARWWAVVEATLALLDGRDGTVCPSEVARRLDPSAWRDRMAEVRDVAAGLADDGVLAVTRGGEPVDPRAPGGPIRLARR